MSQIVILHPAPSHDEDWQTPFAQYAALLGEGVIARCWEDYAPSAEHDLVLPLLAWGYFKAPHWWFSLLDDLEKARVNLANPARVLRWNSDKSYLQDLKAAGVDVVPTHTSPALCDEDLARARSQFASKTMVIKPALSGGAENTFLLDHSDALPPQIKGKRMLVQPFLWTIADEGEYSLFYFGGVFSHAVLKRPAKGDFRVQDQFGGTEQAVVPSAESKALAQGALDATTAQHGLDSLMYARVDMVRGRDGNMQIMELELIEPALFLDHAQDGGAGFARAVKARLAKTSNRIADCPESVILSPMPTLA